MEGEKITHVYDAIVNITLNAETSDCSSYMTKISTIKFQDEFNKYFVNVESKIKGPIVPCGNTLIHSFVNTKDLA